MHLLKRALCKWMKIPQGVLNGTPKKSNTPLAAHLKSKGAVQDTQIKTAFLQIEQGRFVIPQPGKGTQEDDFYPISKNETLSWPSRVANVMHLLAPPPRKVHARCGVGIRMKID